jgi:hypothetical protein
MKNIARLLFASTILLSSVSANAALIYGSYGGSMYGVFGANGITWDAADTAATDAGYHLVTISDAAENTFVTSLIQAANLNQVWAGGYQTGPGAADANWNWVTGEAWSYTNWNGPEPNDYYGPNSEEHLGINWTLDGKWNDEANLKNIDGYVVEKAIPEPSVIALFGLGLLGLGFARRRTRN